MRAPGSVRVRRFRFGTAIAAFVALTACAAGGDRPTAISTSSSALFASKQSSIFGPQPDAKPLRLVVKFLEGTDVRVRNGRLTAASAISNASAVAGDLRAVESELAARGLSLGRLFGQLTDAQLSEAKMRGEARVGGRLPDLGLYHQIPASAFASNAELEQTRLNFASLESVEAAYVEHEPAPPPDANTPDFRTFQTYKDPAPFGMDVQFSATVSGGRGTGVRVIDVESGLRPGHEDHPLAFYQRGELNLELNRVEHTAAVAGIIAGRDNAFGVTGIAPEVQLGSSSFFPSTNTSIAEAMTAPLASGHLRAGDVLLMELQVTGPGTASCACGSSDCVRYVPGEFQPAIFDAIRTLVSNGVTVVEAAGNGYVSLDDPAFQGLFDPTVRDSGAIVVGARAPVSGGPECFSDSGRRVDVNAWGASVYSTGYGNAYQGTLAPHDYYTQNFGGTSSASALVTGAVAALQGVSRALSGAPLSPAALRQLLKSSGTPQTVELNRPIGVQPDLRRAIGVLRGDPQPVETVYSDDFENGFGFFTNLPGAQLPWTRLRGATPSTSTGPSGDHSTGSGYYAYTEATGSSGSPNKTAVLQSPCIDLRGHSAARFAFFFHMQGSQMGTLAAEADPGCDGGPLVTLFTQTGQRTGSELNGYVRQDIDLAQFLGASVRLRVRGTTGSGGLSDMAVDDLRVSVTRAPCTSDAQCPSGVCEASICFECRNDTGCSGGLCVNGECAECRGSADCPDSDGDFCTQPLCTAANACSTQPTPCAPGLVCSSQRARCVECLSNSNCPAGRTCNLTTNVCAPAACTSYPTTTQQHVNAGRATTARVSTRVEARVVGSSELLESRSLFGSFSSTIRPLRTRAQGGYELGSCP